MSSLRAKLPDSIQALEVLPTVSRLAYASTPFLGTRPTGSWLVKDDANYTFAGELTITPPEGHGKSEVWKGVLVLPKVKFSLRNIHARLNVDSDPLVALQGMWEVTSVVVNGAPGEPKGVPANVRPKVQWIITGQKSTIRVAGSDGSGFLLIAGKW